MESSPLKNISLELRNQIWRDVLVAPESTVDIAGKTSPDEPGLLAVCCQIRTEATGVYYSENIFRVQSISGSLPALFLKSKNLVFWLRCIGQKRASMITKLLIATVGNGIPKHEQDFVEQAMQAMRGSSLCEDDFASVARRTTEALLARGVQLQAIDMAAPGLDVKEVVSWFYFKEKFDEVLCNRKGEIGGI